MKRLTIAIVDSSIWLLLVLFYVLIYPPSAALSSIAVLVCLFWAALFFPIPVAYRVVSGYRQRAGLPLAPYGPRWFTAPLAWPPLPAALLSVATLFPACLWHAVLARDPDPIAGAWADVALLLAWVVLWTLGVDLITSYLHARRVARGGLVEQGWRADGRAGWTRRAPRHARTPRASRRTSAHDAALLHAETIVLKRPEGRS
jgi:hypothetical protein